MEYERFTFAPGNMCAAVIQHTEWKWSQKMDPRIWTDADTGWFLNAALFDPHWRKYRRVSKQEAEEIGIPMKSIRGYFFENSYALVDKRCLRRYRRKAIRH